MTIVPGTLLGRYEVLGPLGKGGMGEVYRARDPEVEREVAIKVLPAEMAWDSERLARFEREAKALAALQHPNVATLYGLERQDGQPFLVMELVEGETLAERIARGPLALDEAVPVFSQIADGLAAAHDRGLVHRDLKPANVKITPEGQVKVLDFGLAKAVDEKSTGSGSVDLTQSPTLTAGATAAGVLLGTAAYMSPEQVKGRPVDRRTDVWAWGCCFYEALTGKRAFEGDDVTDILASVLRDEPDWSALPSDLPDRVLRLLLRTLEKDPRERRRDLGDVRLDLHDLRLETSPTTSGESSEGRARWPRLATGALVGTALLMAGLAGGVALLGSRARARRAANAPRPNGSTAPPSTRPCLAAHRSATTTLSRSLQTGVVSPFPGGLPAKASSGSRRRHVRSGVLCQAASAE